MLLALMLGTCSLSQITPAVANLLTNGSFEQGEVRLPHARSYRLEPTDFDVRSWRVVEGNVDWNGRYYRPYDGERSLDLNGTQPGTVAQTFSTVPGRTYLLTFWLSGNPDGGAPVKTLTVTAGKAKAAFAFDTAKSGALPTDMKWQRHSLRFRAESEDTELIFKSTTRLDWGPVIDQVEVSREP